MELVARALLWIWGMELVRYLVKQLVGRVMVRKLVNKVLVVGKTVSSPHQLPAPPCLKAAGKIIEPISSI